MLSKPNHSRGAMGIVEGTDLECEGLDVVTHVEVKTLGGL